MIHDFTLHIGPGEKVGLVGRSGAGKSTLVNLLLRFYDLESGRILIDGQDIAARHPGQPAGADRHGDAGHLAAAPLGARQHPLRPARRGRARGDGGARKAQADDFIAGLEDMRGRKGYDAHVGERGVKLSGGQRQRIAIARVLLKDAPILVLDEATSALDSEVEAAIQEQLYNLMAGKTVIAIAHRLSTIAAMDRLVIMDKGRIVEEGSHAVAAAARRPLRRPVGAPVGRVPGRGGGGGGVGTGAIGRRGGRFDALPRFRPSDGLELVAPSRRPTCGACSAPCRVWSHTIPNIGSRWRVWRRWPS